MNKKLIIIYILIFILGLLAGWLAVSLNKYEELKKNNPAPTFWQVAGPF